MGVVGQGPLYPGSLSTIEGLSLLDVLAGAVVF